MNEPLNIVIVGLSITSSWGNGHATTYRALVRALTRRGHRVLFLERDVPWYAANRDLPNPPFGQTCLYESIEELKETYADAIRGADLVIVGSFVPEGIEAARWVCATAGGVKAFFDIDTPVTLAELGRGTCQYLVPELIPEFELYLSFTGGPTLDVLQDNYSSPRARPLYCSVDPELYFPQQVPPQWDLGYMGTYSDDRQPTVDNLLLTPARLMPTRQFVVAGPQYPESIPWPQNVTRIEHLPPAEHCSFYNQQRLTLNVTRADMIRAGFAPSVRLFEAAACGTPIVSDWWEGLDTFFEPDREIFIADSPGEVEKLLHDTGPAQLREVAMRAREKVLAFHTSARRALELEQYVQEVLGVTQRVV